MLKIENIYSYHSSKSHQEFIKDHFLSEIISLEASEVPVVNIAKLTSVNQCQFTFAQLHVHEHALMKPSLHLH